MYLIHLCIPRNSDNAWQIVGHQLIVLNERMGK